MWEVEAAASWWLPSPWTREYTPRNIVGLGFVYNLVELCACLWGGFVFISHLYFPLYCLVSLLSMYISPATTL